MYHKISKDINKYTYLIEGIRNNMLNYLRSRKFHNPIDVKFYDKFDFWT